MYLLIWPSSKRVYNYLPSPKTTSVINNTEFHIKKSMSPTAQVLTYSSYKHKNTFKALVSITPSGAINFISDLSGWDF